MLAARDEENSNSIAFPTIHQRRALTGELYSSLEQRLVYASMSYVAFTVLTKRENKKRPRLG